MGFASITESVYSSKTTIYPVLFDLNTERYAKCSLPSFGIIGNKQVSDASAEDAEENDLVLE